MADITASLAGWSTTEANNQPDNSDSTGSSGIAANFRAIQAAMKYEASADSIASASTIDMSTKTAKYITVTGTTTITAMGTVAEGMVKVLIFADALTFTHSATALILPTGASITTAAGDVAVMLSLGSGNWRCIGYERKSGLSPGIPALTSGQFLTNNGTTVSWSAPTIPITKSAKSANYTVVAAERGYAFQCTSSFTLTLTAAATTGAGWYVYVGNTGTGDITIACSTNIDSIATGFIMYPGEQRIFYSDGTDYFSVLLAGGSRSWTVNGAVSFKAPPGVKRFNWYAIGAGQGGVGNGSTAGAGGRGGAGIQGSMSLTAGTTYTGAVGAGGTVPAGNGGDTYLTSAIPGIAYGGGAQTGYFNLTTNPNVEGVFVGGAGGAAGNNGSPSTYGGGGGAGGNDGGGSKTGGPSFHAGAGGNSGVAGTAPGGGGAGGDTVGTLGQAGADGALHIWW